jgi:putative transposase
MPNHFHLIIRLKSKQEIRILVNSKSEGANHPTGREDTIEYEISNVLSQIFSNSFNSYSKHCNIWKNRTGTLFKRAFRRKEIEDMEYLRKLICYIHQNPVEAGIANKPDAWMYSSYQAIIGVQPTLIPRKEIISLFGDLQTFIYCNLKHVDLEATCRVVDSLLF